MQQPISFQVYNASAGSGKTYTLVKEYLKILLASDNKFMFQQILAVTFTNKAAGEMKERVIKNLYQYSKAITNTMVQDICRDLEMDENEVFSKSKNILDAILQNYTAFTITTIDSFTHKLIRTFAFDLGLPHGFDVEMDTESILSEAVDMVLARIGKDKILSDLLVNYALQKLDEDKSWDIAQDLKSFAHLILNENHAIHLEKLSEYNIETFTNLKKTLLKQQKSIEAEFEVIGQKGLEIVEEFPLKDSDFAHGGDLPKHFRKLKSFKFLKADDLKFSGRLDKSMAEEKNLYSAKCNLECKEIIENQKEDLKALYRQSKDYYNQKFGSYILSSLTIEGLIPLAVLNYINTAVRRLKEENNILFNAEFNKLINDTIKNEPAPFIYERLGEKFRYYFIDEMQDTSILQWENLIPLIENALSSQSEDLEVGKLLLVGDAKQSIYRWRGGRASQFMNLSSSEQNASNNPFFVKKEVLHLDTNYRSYDEVIRFNNSFFKHASSYLSNALFQNVFIEGSKQKSHLLKGGYVQLSFLEKEVDKDLKQTRYPTRVLEIIKGLEGSYQKNEICVLVRKRAQGVEIANFLSAQGIDIISSETLLLKSDIKVQFLVNLMQLIQNPTQAIHKAKATYFLYEFFQPKTAKHDFISDLVSCTNRTFFEKLRCHGSSFDLDTFLQKPFFERVEYMISSFNLTAVSDGFLQYFLDEAFDFQIKKRATIEGFLDYWELKKDKLSLVAPDAEHAVRIMTIHKAKGLEFPVVIFPYDIDIYHQIKPKVWLDIPNGPIPYVLVNYGNKLNYIGPEGIHKIEKRKEQLEFDNFNLLYVTMTRAVEQLYIVTEKNSRFKNDGKLGKTSNLFVNYLKQIGAWNEQKLDYYFGVPERNSIPENKEVSTIEQKKFISNVANDERIRIAKNASLLWETDREASINYGNLIHEILSKIVTVNDIEEVLEHYAFTGVLSARQMGTIKETINSIVNHSQLNSVFKQNNTVYNEREIITKDKKVIIPDRIVIENGKTIIVDYKTGKPSPNHKEQIRNYEIALRELGYHVHQKLLVYIDDEIVVEEV